MKTLNRFLSPQVVLGIFLLSNTVHLWASSGEEEDLFRYGNGARAVALGGSLNAITGDASALYYNPAGLAEVHQMEIGADWSSLFAGAQYGGVTAAIPVPKSFLGSFSAGIMGVLAPQIKGFGADGIGADHFSFGEFKVTAGYGGLVSFFPALRYGMAVKTDITTFGADTSLAFRFDLGLQLRLGQEGKVRFLTGLVARDLFSLETGVKRDSVTRFALGSALLLPFGKAVELRTPVELSLELSDGVHSPLAFSAGLEGVLWKIASLRVGLDTSAQISAGAGLSLGQFRLDYALVSKAYGLTHNLSFTTTFGRLPGVGGMKESKLPGNAPVRNGKKIAFLVSSSLYESVSELTLRKLADKNPVYTLSESEAVKGDPEDVWSRPDAALCSGLAKEIKVSKLILIVRTGANAEVLTFDAEKNTLTPQGKVSLKKKSEAVSAEDLNQDLVGVSL